MSDDRVTAEDLQRETEALEVLTGEFALTRDPEQIAQLTELTQAQALRLQEMADRMGAEHEEAWAEQAAQLEADGGGRMRGEVEIVLSPRQRERVEALTGERVESVSVDDRTGTLTLGMKAMDPTQVELWAVRDVIARRRERDAVENSGRAERAARARISAVRRAADLDDLPDPDDGEEDAG